MTRSPIEPKCAPRRWALAWGGAFTLLLAACGQDPAEPDPPANPLVFEISSPDGSVEGWMIGTIHALPDGVNWRSPAVIDAVTGADYLIVEVAKLDDREKTAAAFANLATSTAVLPPLAERVPQAQRPALSSLISRSDYAPGDFVHTETWAAALMLAQLHSIGKSSNGVDLALIREFSDREVREFEGAIGQLGIFDALDEDDQRDLLEVVVKASASDKNEATKLLEAWLAGDLPALEEATTTGMMADPELREALLIGRNKAWAGSLVGILDEKPKPLVAVGAAHLVGSEGLPALLEAEGYSVRRLN